VKMLRDAGAREVHMRISSPPDMYPCFYGIDTAIRKELIASSRKVEEIRSFIGADTLHYLSMDNLVKATRRRKEDFCTACFDGEYPVPVPDDMMMTKCRLEDGKVRVQ
jgi:amidophosphoribosyltransferase